MRFLRSPTFAFVSPYAAFVLVMALAGLLPPAIRPWSYVAQIILCGALVIGYWRFYQFKVPVQWLFTLFTAILVLALWILLRLPSKETGFDPTIFRNNPPLFYAVLGVRFFRLVVIVGFAEEIFWRGFLLRFLVKEDFESVPPGTFTWTSFLVVTAGFCLEHGFPDYPAAILTGALFNFVYYRTRSLASCVLAHAVANFLLGIYIMRTGQWGFW